MLDIPDGYRFCPTDLEAFAYLYKKLSGMKEHEEIQLEVIAECDVYECEPCNLPLRGENNNSYYFTRRTIKSATMVDRCTKDGKGYWRITGTVPKFKSGKKNTLVYYYKAKNEAGKGVKTDWIMHEYELPDSITDDTKSGSTDGGSSSSSSTRPVVSKGIVLCRIYEHRERELEDDLRLKLLMEKLLNNEGGDGDNDEPDCGSDKAPEDRTLDLISKIH